MNSRRAKAKTFLLALALLATVSSFGQDGILRVQERAQYLSDFEQLLKHDDPNVRLAAIEEALSGEDQQVRSMALETALASGDERLQTAALSWYVGSRSKLLVTFVMPDRPTAVQKYILAKWDGLILENPKIAPNGSEIEFSQYYGKGGQLVRGGLEFRFDAAYASRGICVMKVKPAGGTVLAGSFSCTFSGYEEAAGGTQGAVPVRLDLS